MRSCGDISIAHPTHDASSSTPAFPHLPSPPRPRTHRTRAVLSPGKGESPSPALSESYRIPTGCDRRFQRGGRRMRGRAGAAHRALNPEIAGSNPAPAVSCTSADAPRPHGLTLPPCACPGTRRFLPHWIPGDTVVRPNVGRRRFLRTGPHHAEAQSRRRPRDHHVPPADTAGRGTPRSGANHDSRNHGEPERDPAGQQGIVAREHEARGGDVLGERCHRAASGVTMTSTHRGLVIPDARRCALCGGCLHVDPPSYRRTGVPSLVRWFLALTSTLPPGRPLRRPGQFRARFTQIPPLQQQSPLTTRPARRGGAVARWGAGRWRRPHVIHAP
jgi:hypothetical protein